MSNCKTRLPQVGRAKCSESHTASVPSTSAVCSTDSGGSNNSIVNSGTLNLRNRQVNRHCNTLNSCRVQAGARRACSKNDESTSSSVSGRRSVTPSRATVTHTHEENNINPHPPASAVSGVTQVGTSTTTNAGKPRKRMKWTIELNSFIMRSYFKITKMETDMTTYRYALHCAFIEHFPEFQHLTEQRIADQRRSIVKNNLLPDPTLQQIRGEVLLDLQNEENDILTDHDTHEPENAQEDNNGVEKTNIDCDKTPDNDYNTELCKALAEFNGTNPIHRPKLPKLRTNKSTNSIIAAVNLLLQNHAKDCKALEQLHTLIYCGAVAVLRIHNQRIQFPENNQSKDYKQLKPWWQRRLESSIDDIRRELGQLTEFKNNLKPSRRLTNRVRKIYRKIKTYTGHPQHERHVFEYIDSLRQKLKAKSKRLSRYVKCTKRKQQNYLFNNNQKLFYRQLSGTESNQNQSPPNKDELTEYWSSLWSKPVEHKSNAHWIRTEEEKINIEPMSFVDLTTSEVTEAIKSTSNWKTPGVDHVQNFWYKKFDSLHEAMATSFSHILQHPEDTPPFLTLGSTHLLPKTHQTHDPSQYRPITCLPTIYKILTACITNRIYRHVDQNNILSEEQKGCRRDHQGCKEQLIIDSVILKQAQKEKRNIHTAFVDYRKAFDSVPHSWLVKVLQIYKVHPTVVTFLESAMKHWRTNLHLQINGQYLQTDEISIRRGIFQGDSLSPLWFCLAMNPLSNLLNDTDYGYKLKANRNTSCTVSHLLYMDDIKIYASNQRQIQHLLNITEKFSSDIQMGFGLDKCKTLNIEKGKIVNGDVLLPNGNIITAMQNGETYKYLGFQQAKLLDQKQAKIKIRSQFTQRVTTLLKSQLNAGNLAKAINTYAIPILTYSFGILKWTKTELEDIQRTTRTMMTKHKCHHPTSSVIRTTLPRREGGRGLVDIVNLHNKQISRLQEFFIAKAETSELHEMVAKADKNYSPLNLVSPDMRLGIVTDSDKQVEWAQKALHGRHHHDLNQPHIDKEASNKWLSDGTLFPETEGFMMAIQDQVINTNNYKKFVMKDPNIATDKCRRCQQTTETIQHITSGCSALANIDYLRRHNQLCNIIHQKLANKFGLVNTYTPYYKYHPNSVLENADFRLYYDRSIITDRRVTNNRPDIVVVDKKANSVYLVDVAVPNNNNILDKYNEKIAKCTDIAIEVRHMWHADKLEVVPIIVSSTGLIPKTLEDSLTKLGLHKNTYIDLQKAAILNTCHTVREFLNM